MLPVRATLRTGRQVFVGTANGRADELAELLRAGELVPALDPRAIARSRRPRELRVRPADVVELVVFGPRPLFGPRWWHRAVDGEPVTWSDVALEGLVEAVEAIERELRGRGPHVEL